MDVGVCDDKTRRMSGGTDWLTNHTMKAFVGGSSQYVILNALLT